MAVIAENRMSWDVCPCIYLNDLSETPTVSQPGAAAAARSEVTVAPAEQAAGAPYGAPPGGWGCEALAVVRPVGSTSTMLTIRKKHLTRARPSASGSAATQTAPGCAHLSCVLPSPPCGRSKRA